MNFSTIWPSDVRRWESLRSKEKSRGPVLFFHDATRKIKVKKEEKENTPRVCQIVGVSIFGTELVIPFSWRDVVDDHRFRLREELVSRELFFSLSLILDEHEGIFHFISLGTLPIEQSASVSKSNDVLR